MDDDLNAAIVSVIVILEILFFAPVLNKIYPGIFLELFSKLVDILSQNPGNLFFLALGIPLGVLFYLVLNSILVIFLVYVCGKILWFLLY